MKNSPHLFVSVWQWHFCVSAIIGLLMLFRFGESVHGATVVSRDTLLAVSWDGFSYHVDVATGSATMLARPERLFNAMARSSDGTFLASDNSNRLHTIDPLNGVAQFFLSVQGAGLNETIRGMAFTHDERLLAVMSTPFDTIDSFYEINLITGQAVPIGNTGLSALQSLAISPRGVVYSFDIGPAGRGLVTIDTATGTATDVNPLQGAQSAAIQALAFRNDGSLFGIGQNGIYVVDVHTGIVTRTSDFSIDIRGAEFVIPEPSGMDLLVVLLAGVYVSRRWSF
jgi:hypothetical protein